MHNSLIITYEQLKCAKLVLSFNYWSMYYVCYKYYLYEPYKVCIMIERLENIPDTQDLWFLTLQYKPTVHLIDCNKQYGVCNTAQYKH